MAVRPGRAATVFGDRANVTTVNQFRFGAGGDTLRAEDGPLLTGQGNFTDDINLPRQAHAVFVRSPMGHAKIRSIQATAAKKLPGVLAIISADDLTADGVGTIPPLVIQQSRDGNPMFGAPMPVLSVGGPVQGGHGLSFVTFLRR